MPKKNNLIEQLFASHEESENICETVVAVDWC